MSEASPPPPQQPPEGTYPGWPPPPPPPEGTFPVLPPPPPGSYPPYPPPYPYRGAAPQAPSSRGTAGWIVGGCAALAVVVLAGCVVSTLAFGRIVGVAIHRVASAVTVESSTSQQFAVSGIPTIVVDNQDGSVVVRGGAADTVMVDATMSATGASTTAAQRYLEGISVNATQSGDTITVRTAVSGSGSPLYPRTAALVISVPSASNLNVSLQAGDVELNNVAGAIVVTLQAGDCNAQGLTLQDGSRITVALGSVLLDGALAPGASAAISVQRGDATLTLPAATSAHVVASASTGSISVSGWSIPIQQRGSGATAAGDLGAGGAGSLTVTVTTGDIVMSAK